MSTKNTDYENLTPDQVRLRQLEAAERQVAAAEELAELTRRNTIETRDGKAAQRGDTFKELEQKQLTGRIGLAKAYFVAAGGATKIGGQLAGKRHQETLAGIFGVVGLLNSTAFGIYEAHITLRQINRQKNSLGKEIDDDLARRNAQEAQDQAGARGTTGVPISVMAGSTIPGANGPPGTS